MDGFFNVDKPGGMTSHDVVAAIRRASRQRRVGHAGTLDPAAEGVLLVGLGTGTRVVEYLMSGSKRYRATIALGVTTTTDDAEGQVTSRRETAGIGLEEVEQTLSGLVGRITQIPPMYSALKVGGRPLHELARAGIEVERRPREVEVYELNVVDWQPPRVTVEVHCGKGTYVRTLARDLGERLGCGAHLAHLIRTASGRFTREDAVPLGALVEGLGAGRGEDWLYPPDEALLDLGAIVVGPEGKRRLTTGSPWRPARVLREPQSLNLCRVYSLDGEILAVGEFDATAGAWRPVKALAPAAI